MPAFGTGSLQVVRNASAPTPPKFSSRNEAFFENLLVSAYSIQQKQDLIRSNVSAGRFNEILVTVMDTRSLLRNPTLHLDTAMHLILSRTQKLSGAPGAALYIAEGGMIEYVAGTGIGLGLIGTSFPESQCTFFARARTRPAIEWGELDEPEVKARIAAGFELRAPVCSGGKVVGCLKLFSRIRQFNPEVVHFCELMAAFLGQIIEKQAPPAARDVRQIPKESHRATNSYEWLRKANAAAPTTPMPISRIEPKRNAAPINNHLSLRTLLPTAGQHPTGDSQSEEEPLANESHVANSYEWPRKVYAAAPTTPTPISRIEPQRNAAPISNQLPLRAALPTGGHYPAGDGQSEGEPLPTIGQLLWQLGVAMEEGVLLESPQPRTDQPPECDAVHITADARPELPVVPAKQESDVLGTIEPVTPVLVDTDQPEQTRQTAIRRMRSNVAALYFPTFTLIFCLSLSLTQTSVSSLFRVLTFLSIAFSVIEIWRAGYGNR